MRTIICAALLLFPMVARADGDTDSGPKAGEKVAALKVFVAVGEPEGKEADLAAERKDGPTIYIFVQADKFTRPMNRFMKILDGEVGKLDDNARMVAVWLTDDADKSKTFLPRVQMSVKYEKTALTVFPGDKSGPQNWGINPDAHITAVVAHQGKVVASFGYLSVNDTDVPKVRDALKKALGK
jgi:hypothetical protein